MFMPAACARSESTKAEPTWPTPFGSSVPRAKTTSAVAPPPAKRAFAIPELRPRWCRIRQKYALSAEMRYLQQLTFASANSGRAVGPEPRRHAARVAACHHSTRPSAMTERKHDRASESVPEGAIPPLDVVGSEILPPVADDV